MSKSDTTAGESFFSRWENVIKGMPSGEQNARASRDAACWASAIEGEISPALRSMLQRVHPDQHYSSAEAALLCRQAYDLGKKEACK